MRAVEEAGVAGCESFGGFLGVRVLISTNWIGRIGGGRRYYLCHFIGVTARDWAIYYRLCVEVLWTCFVCEERKTPGTIQSPATTPIIGPWILI